MVVLAALVFLPVVVGLVFYFHGFLRRALEAFSLRIETRRTKILLWCVSALLGGTCFFFTSLPALFVIYLFGFALLCDIFRGVGYLITHKRFPHFFANWKRIFGCGVLPIVLSVGMLLFGAGNMMHITPTYYTVETAKDIREEGIRVALVADVHFGVSLDMTEIEALCDAIEEEDVDLLVLCGDIVDESTDRTEIPALFEAFGGVESTYGTYYVFGNHDRLRRASEEDLAAIIEAAGVTVLCEESVSLAEDLVLIGREDRSGLGNTDRRPIADLLSESEDTAFRLVLDHQPSEYAENGMAGTDLLLSGHTHGGQFWPLNIVQSIVPFNDAVYGETPLGGGGTAIVTSGVAGWKYPIKTVAPAEYVIIDIVGAK